MMEVTVGLLFALSATVFVAHAYDAIRLHRGAGQI